MNWKTFREQFDLYFDGFIQEKIEYITDELSMDVLPIIDYMQDYHMGGKRFRPYMVYLWYKLAGGQEDVYTMMKIGMINELIHLMALVHDDIMDKGTTRHGMDCYHTHLAKYYQDEHLGISQAIVVGDLFYTWALQELISVESLASREIIMQMLQKVIIGQMIDVHYSRTDEEKDLDAISQKDHLKSGQYTFQGPMLFGAGLAGTSEQKMSDIASIGKMVGVAFQMRDDLLDWLPQDDGKTKFSDVQEGNQTVVWLTLMNVIDPEEKHRLQKMRGTSITGEDKQWLMELIEKHNVQQLVCGEMAHYLDQAQEKIDNGTWPEEYKEHFDSIVDYLRTV